MTITDGARRFVVPALGLVLMAVLSARAAGALPDPVIFDDDGQRAPRLLVLIGMPLLTVLLAAVLLSAQRLRRVTAARLRIPLWRDDRTHRRLTGLALTALVPVLLAGHLLILRAAQGRASSAMGWLAAAVALLVVLTGNAWPRQVPRAVEPGLDRFAEAWRRTQRPTGIAMVVLGLIGLACSLVAPWVSLGISLSAVVVLAAILIGSLVQPAAGPDS